MYFLLENTQKSNCAEKTCRCNCRFFPETDVKKLFTKIASKAEFRFSQRRFDSLNDFLRNTIRRCSIPLFALGCVLMRSILVSYLQNYWRYERDSRQDLLYNFIVCRVVQYVVYSFNFFLLLFTAFNLIFYYCNYYCEF